MRSSVEGTTDKAVPWPSLQVLLKLFSYCVKVKVNRQQLVKPEMNTLNVMLGTLNLVSNLFSITFLLLLRTIQRGVSLNRSKLRVPEGVPQGSVLGTLTHFIVLDLGPEARCLPSAALGEIICK